MNLTEKISILEDLARSWASSEHSFAVANGLRGYPETIGRDIDVVFEKRDLAWAVEHTEQFFRARGFHVLSYKLGWPHWIVAIRVEENGVGAVQVDLFDHLQWAFGWVVDGIDPKGELEMNGPFQVDPWASVGKRIFLNGLSGNFETFKSKPWYLETTESERVSMKRNLMRLAGRDFPDLRSAIARKNVDQIREGFVDFRRAVMRQSMLSPSKWAKRMWSAWLKQYYFNLNPPWHVPVVVIRGDHAECLVDFTTRFISKLQGTLPFAIRKIDPVVMKKGGLLCRLRFRRGIRRSSALLEVPILSVPVSDSSQGPILPASVPSIFCDSAVESPTDLFDRLVHWFQQSSHCVARFSTTSPPV